jgi:hypothetical protein
MCFLYPLIKLWILLAPKWLVDYCQNRKIPICECSIHSHNPVGANNIHSLINGYKKHMDSPQDCYIGKHPFTTEKQNTTI